MTQYYLTREDELYHWGIKGQKWGLRRWQNADGSFNEDGKKRYFGEAKSTYKDKVLKAKQKYRKDNLNILSKDEQNKRLEILNKSEWMRTSREERLLNEYNDRLNNQKQKNLDNKNKRIKQAKEEYRNTKEYKIRKAVTIGATIAGTALAVYGGYKLNKYLKDQKTIMSLKDAKSTIEKLIPQYDANIKAINNKQLTIPFFDGSSENATSRARDAYIEQVKKYRKQVSDINSNIDSISKKHLYNFGKKYTTEQYNTAVSALAKGTKSALSGTAKVGKDLVKFILDNADAVVKFIPA